MTSLGKVDVAVAMFDQSHEIPWIYPSDIHLWYPMEISHEIHGKIPWFLSIKNYIQPPMKPGQLLSACDGKEEDVLGQRHVQTCRRVHRGESCLQDLPKFCACFRFHFSDYFSDFSDENIMDIPGGYEVSQRAWNRAIWRDLNDSTNKILGFLPIFTHHSNRSHPDVFDGDALEFTSILHLRISELQTCAPQRLCRERATKGRWKGENTSKMAIFSTGKRMISSGKRLQFANWKMAQSK